MLYILLLNKYVVNRTNILFRSKKFRKSCLMFKPLKISVKFHDFQFWSINSDIEGLYGLILEHATPNFCPCRKCSGKIQCQTFGMICQTFGHATGPVIKQTQSKTVCTGILYAFLQ
jgi:hypothetical protein